MSQCCERGCENWSQTNLFWLKDLIFFNFLFGWFWFSKNYTFSRNVNSMCELQQKKKQKWIYFLQAKSRIKSKKGVKLNWIARKEKLKNLAEAILIFDNLKWFDYDIFK